jgi:hypothetical protein
MGYFWLEGTYTDETGKERGTVRGVPADTLEEAIAKTYDDLLSDNATNINIFKSPPNKGFPYAIDELFDLAHAKAPHIPRSEFKDWMLGGVDRESTLREKTRIVPLEEARSWIVEDDYDDFVYIRSLGLVVFNVGSGTSHQLFCGQWAAMEDTIFKGGSEDDWMLKECEYSDGVGQDRFLDANFGVFMSRAFQLRTCYKGKDFTLTAQERQVFAGLEFRTP